MLGSMNRTASLPTVSEQPAQVPGQAATQVPAGAVTRPAFAPYSPSVRLNRLAGSALTLLLPLSLVAALAPVNSFDSAELAFDMSLRDSLLTTFFLGLTDLFTPVNIVAITLLAGLILAWRTRSLALPLQLVGAVAASSAAAQIIKQLVGRHRPDLAMQLVNETDLSFPSGHATGIVSLVTALILVAAALTAHRTGRTVRVLVWALGLLAALVCFSRLYVGAHWTSDVIAGTLLGFGATVLFFTLSARPLARLAR